jgi:hypothetical protein
MKRTKGHVGGKENLPEKKRRRKEKKKLKKRIISVESNNLTLDATAGGDDGGKTECEVKRRRSSRGGYQLSLTLPWMHLLVGMMGGI